VETKSGKTFGQSRTDWKWKSPVIVSTLKNLHLQGVKLVIFTNQAGVGGGKIKDSEMTGKISDIVSDIGLPIQVFMGMLALSILCC